MSRSPAVNMRARLRRYAAAVGLPVVFVVALFAAPLSVSAQTAPTDSFLGDAEAAELANELADAKEELDACFGWEVLINNSPVSIGSNGGPGVSVESLGTECVESAVLTVTLYYTSEADEANDSASYSLISNVSGAPSTSEMAAAADVSESSFLGENDDDALVRSMLVVPLLIGEVRSSSGEAIEFAVPETAAITDTVNGSPGNDVFRSLRMPIFGSLLFGALGGVLIGHLYKKSRNSL
jgi:hypothetical protein